MTNLVSLRAEVRSHDPQFRMQIVEAYKAAFERAARAVTSSDGATGSVEIDVRHKYESFRLSLDEPSVRAAMAAVRESGLEPETRISNGGLDANWLVRKGIPTVTFGAGQHNIHTTDEYVELQEFYDGCRMALALATYSGD